MSDAPASPTIGDVVDASSSAIAHEAASSVADSIPPTTVVVENPADKVDPADTTNTGLDTAAHVRQIAREEADKYMSDLIAYENARKAAEQPDVVVVEVQADEQVPPPVVASPDMPPAPEPKADDAPPMARSHPYFKPLRGGKK
jgi:hypothetical protein